MKINVALRGSAKKSILAGHNSTWQADAICNAPILRVGDVTATYIRRSEIPSRIYAKHQYRQESEYGSTLCIIHSNI